jgi:ApeA N-terminal domain 1
MRNPHTYSEDRFMNLVWGLEAFHRKSLGQPSDTERTIKKKERIERIINFLPNDSDDRRWLQKKLKYAYEPSLELRILECFRELPFSFGKGELERFAKECASRRNDISHEGGPRGDMDYASFSTSVNKLAEALDHLFHALLLHETGVDSNVLFETMNSSWQAERRIKPALAEVGLQIQALK